MNIHFICTCDMYVSDFRICFCIAWTFLLYFFRLLWKHHHRSCYLGKRIILYIFLLLCVQNFLWSGGQYKIYGTIKFPIIYLWHRFIIAIWRWCLRESIIKPLDSENNIGINCVDEVFHIKLRTGDLCHIGCINDYKTVQINNPLSILSLFSY